MSVPLSVEAQQLLKLLDDGDWHRVPVVVDRLASQIAPGKALRRYDSREKTRQEKEGPRRGPELSDSDKIASGQRTLANVAFNSMKKNYLDVELREGERWVRKRPIEAEPGPPPVAMPTWGRNGPATVAPPEPTPVGDEQTADLLETEAARIAGQEMRHGEHAADFVNGIEYAAGFARKHGTPAGPPPDVAFMSETQLRQIVREELQAALAQMSMQIEVTDGEKAAVRRVIRAEMNASLDEFQRGLQEFLTDRLATVEDVARTAALRALARQQQVGGWVR